MSDPLDALYEVRHIVVPNEIRVGAPIAIIGQNAGEEEANEGMPFVGASGRMLWSLATQAGFSRSQCSVLNVCPLYLGEGKSISDLPWDGPDLTLYREQLLADIAKAKPNVILLVGHVALRVAFGEVRSINDWRCSVFWSPILQCKCVAAPHPADIFKNYSDRIFLRVALKRTAEESKTATFNPRPLNIVTIDTPDRVGTFEQWADKVITDHLPIAFDIEGGLRSMSCISFATTPDDAVVVPFTKPDCTSFWPLDCEVRIWKVLIRLLGNRDVPKILQNYLYDAMVLRYGYGLPVRGPLEDTMLKHWDILCEMEKNLGVLVQLYTNRPYHKFGLSSTGQQLWTYCGTDSATTLDACRNMDRHFDRDTAGKWHYNFNVSLLEPFLYMQMRGMAFDASGAKTALDALNVEIYAALHAANVTAGTTLPNNVDDLISIVHSTCCYKRSVLLDIDDLLTSPLKLYQQSIYRIYGLIKQLNATGMLADHEWGELESLLDLGINVDSPARMKTLLYETWKFPKQYKKEHGRKTSTITTEGLAILNLFIKFKDQRLLDLLRLRQKCDQRAALSMSTDKDGRIRCGYIVVGSETGRIACKTSITGSGGNLQTVPSRFRWIFPADPGMHFFYKDLSGADTWTVAARLAALGDRTMLDDLLFGLKPAKLVALMYVHGVKINKLSREELKQLSKEVNKSSWMYMGSKRVVHGDNYGMGENTMSDQLLKDSFKYGESDDDLLYVPPEDCLRLRNYYRMRYPGLAVWHRYCDKQLRETGKLTSAGGHTRVFLDRRDDKGTLNKYLAEEPQANTTFVTNRALLSLWRDPENRRPDGSLIIIPAHQVHDALCGYFPIDVTDWAVKKINSYFDRPVTIAGITLTIPSEGGYGPSWGQCDNPM